MTDENFGRQLITQYSLEDLVTIHGFVPADELTNALSRSDLALNLRDPTMGEASASQLRIWQHQLPSLVTDTGWYATLPPDTVAIVRRNAELEDIRSHLAKFLSTPETYRAIGRNGRRHLDEHHTAARYVDRLFELIELTLRNQSAADVSWMAGRAGRAIRPWFSDGAAGVLLPKVAHEISDLFDEHSKRA
jgi:glycosyltransferase involved in cell wall biosynthesis